MKDEARTPSIRFAGFTDAWEQREFGTDLISIQTGTNKLGSSQGKGTPLLKMGNIQRGYFSLDKIEYLSESDQVEPDNIANYGDFFFNTRNTLELVGKGATWIGESGKYAFNSNIARFKFKDLDTIFFNYLYNTASMIEQVHARAMGTTSVAAIYPQSLKSIEYNVPSMDEQRVIGRFLLEIDTLITLHQRKYDQLVNIKKSMLEKMFPKNGELVPEVRFAGFTDAWEQRKLGELCDVFRSGEFIKASDIYIDGAFPVYGGNGLRGHADRFNYDGNYALIGRQGALCGNMNFSSGKAYFTEHAVAVHANDNNNTRFLFYLLDTMNLGQYSAQSAQPGLAVNKLITLPALCPSKLEQETIAEFLTRIDRLITLHQRKLERLQNIKRACLEKMFV